MSLFFSRQDLFQQTLNTVLLVNVAVALLLHPVLEDHRNAEYEDEVDSDNAERRCEDLIQILVGLGRELADAATLLRRNKGVFTSAINHERGSGRVDVAAAVELDLVSE